MPASVRNCKCQRCRRGAKKLRRHLETVHRKRKSKAAKVAKVEARENVMMAREGRQRRFSSGQTELKSCPICLKMFDNLGRHLERVHPNDQFKKMKDGSNGRQEWMDRELKQQRYTEAEGEEENEKSHSQKQKEEKYNYRETERVTGRGNTLKLHSFTALAFRDASNSPVSTDNETNQNEASTSGLTGGVV